MKKTLFIIFITLLSLNSCIVELFEEEVENDHVVKVSNWYRTNDGSWTEADVYCIIGATSFGTVSYGTTTNHLSVGEGVHTIVITTPDGSLTKTIECTGKGYHEWTVHISQNGEISIMKNLYVAPN